MINFEFDVCGPNHHKRLAVEHLDIRGLPNQGFRQGASPLPSYGTMNNLRRQMVEY